MDVLKIYDDDDDDDDDDADKRIVRQGKDVVGNSSMKNIQGELVTDESDRYGVVTLKS